jgi:hypothetical protein
LAGLDARRLHPPFLWIGVAMTLPRAEDASQSTYLAVLYFVPVVNYLLMLTLCVLLSRPASGARGRPWPWRSP